MILVFSAFYFHSWMQSHCRLIMLLQLWCMNTAFQKQFANRTSYFLLFLSWSRALHSHLCLLSAEIWALPQKGILKRDRDSPWSCQASSDSVDIAIQFHLRGCTPEKSENKSRYPEMFKISGVQGIYVQGSYLK